MAHTINYSISNIILTRSIYAEFETVHDTYNFVTPAHDICVMNGFKAIIIDVKTKRKREYTCL
jgi:hypothetical protein